MSLLTQIKPISYLNANAAKIAQDLKEDGEHYVITQNGKPVMVVQSVHEYEHMQETLAMFKMLAQSEHVIANGSTIPADVVITKLRKQQSL
jgi:prevent-host-death family protein